MQILRCLFNIGAHEAHAAAGTSSTLDNEKETPFDLVAKPSRLVLHKESESSSYKSSSKYTFCTDLFRRDTARAFFYSSLSLKRLRSINRSHRSRRLAEPMKMKKEDLVQGLGFGSNNKTDSGVHAGNKVIPVSDTALASSPGETKSQCESSSEKKDRIKRERTKAISKMKELLRWAAAARSEKGSRFIGRKVLRFRNRGNLKEMVSDDQLSYDSPKISFKWDVESCSTTSSAYSAFSMASSLKNDPNGNNPSVNSRTGNWITTDSEFVVLEL